MILLLLVTLIDPSIAFPQFYETWKLASKNRFYMTITGYYDEALLLETKAHCAFNNFLPVRYITFEEKDRIPLLFKQLSPIMDHEDLVNAYEFARNATKMEEINERATRILGEMEEKMNKTSNLRIYKDYVINKDEFEDVDTSPIWTHFDFDYFENTAQLNLTADTYSILRFAIGHYREELNYQWPLYQQPRNEETFQKTQSFLEMRVKELEYKSYLDPISDLFWYYRLSPRLYTKEIRDHIQKIRPDREVAATLRESFFEVIGCAEKPMVGGGASIVLALRSAIPKA